MNQSDPEECRAFIQLIEEHQEALLNRVRRALSNLHDAEDIVQNAFQAAWADSAFDPCRPDALGYLRQRMDWLVADFRRHGGGHRPLSQVGGGETAEDPREVADAKAMSPLEELLETEATKQAEAMKARLAEAIGSLDARSQQVIQLWLQGASLKQSAELLGLSQAQVNNIRHRAKERIKHALGPDTEEP